MFLDVGLDNITFKSLKFVRERKWEKHDTTTNLTLALSSEIGELADLFAWVGNDISAQKANDMHDKVAQELADIIIILTRIAHLHSIGFQT